MTDIDNLPLVSLLYPDIETDDLVERLVSVIEMNDTHLMGYEGNRGDDYIDPPKYKKYKLSKIAMVQLVSFKAA